MPVRPPRVYIQRFNTTQVRVEAPATSRRAKDGELFFDPETRTLRLGNGVAAGGVILAGPSGDVSSQLVAEQATFTLQANGDVVLEGTIRDAEGNDLLDIANTAPELPVASATELGGVKLGEGFVVNESTSKVTTSKLYSTNATNNTVHYRMELDTNGVVVLPDHSIINGATLRVVPGTGELNYAALAAGPTTQQAEKTWIWADADGASIETDSYDNQYTWHFDNSGNLTLPGNIVTGTDHITLTTNGLVATETTAGSGYSNGARTNVPTTGGSGTGMTVDFFVTVGGAQGIAPNSLTINNPGSGYKAGDVITVTTGSVNGTFTLSASGDLYNWTFDSNGILTLPEGGSILDSSGSPIGTNTADFAFDTTSTRSTLYLGTNSANSTMSLSTSGVEGSAYIEIPGDNAVGNGLNIYNTGTSGRILARATEKVEIRSDNNDVMVSTDNGPWTFRADGKLEFPNSTKQDTAIYATGSVTTESVNYIDDYANPIAAGMTSVDLEAQDLAYDDDKIYIQLPFEIKVFGRWITDITVSSNGYIVFEKEFSEGAYYPQGDENDFINKVKAPFLSIFGHDNSWQKVWTKATVDQFIVRWEGNISNSVGFGGSSNLIYNVVFHSGSEQIDVYCVAGTGSTLSFVSNSWSNVYDFNNSPGNAYIVHTSPYLYDADGNITLSGGARISTSGYNSDSLVANVFAKGDQYAGLDWKGTNTVYAGPSGIDVYTNSSGTAYEEGSENLWNFGAGGNLSLPNGNVIGGGEIPAVVDTTTSITNYAYDATGTTVMMESGDTVDFPNFSGIVTVTCYASGVLSQYLCGSGDTPQRIGSSRAASHTGAMTANGGIGGYTFSASETGEHCFYVVRTRTGA